MRMIQCMADAEGLVLSSQKEVVRLAFAEIEYVEVINKTVFFYLVNGAVREVVSALSVFEDELLSRPEFLKTHRSYLVNLKYIQAMDAGFAVTKRGNNVPISRQRRAMALNAYTQFWHQPDPISSVSAGVPSGQNKKHNGPWRILLVDDNAADLAFWADILSRHGCHVRMAESGKEALMLAAAESFDCVLLDVMIPGEDGFSICEKIRKHQSIPVIFLSCHTESDRQVEGFAAGGIDYITKDTPEKLFWAKVETRIKLASSECTQFQDGPLLLDLVARNVRMGERRLCVTPAEFDILWCLAEHSGRVFTVEEIYGIVWGAWSGDDRLGDDHSSACCLEDDGKIVQLQMSRLRRKLEKAWGGHCYIESVWGQGYRFVPVDQASCMEGTE